jgi:pSer/pThr/pTyr-binding forkhead associated (FHA) protein
MLGQLVPVGGGDPIPLLKTPLLIGRRSRCDIVLDFPNVSSQHCELAFINGFWQIRDLGSSNGIKVNGERLDTKFLQPGDMVTIAKHQFTINFAPGAAAPPPEEEDPFAMSLLEKAGLEKRRDEARQHRKSAAAVKPPKPKTYSADEDEANRWLEEE